MTVFGVHICQEEIFALAASLPFAAASVARLRSWWSKLAR